MSTPVLTKLNVSVQAAGELVTLTIGNVWWKLDHETAIKLGAWLVVEAKEARRLLGESRSYVVVGVMHNATQERKPAPVPSLRDYEWAKERSIRVRLTQELLISVDIGKRGFSLPHKAARAIGIWLRVRGKQARNALKDPRHWSEIGKLAAIEAGENPMATRQH